MYYQPELVKGADEGLVSNGEPKTPMGRLVLELLEYVDHQLPRDMPTSTAYYGVPHVTAITLTLSQTEGDEASKLAAAAKAAAAHQAEAIAAAERHCWDITSFSRNDPDFPSRLPELLWEIGIHPQWLGPRQP